MKKLYTLVAMALVSAMAQAQWQSVEIPGIGTGGSVQQWMVDGNTIWAGSTGQIFRSPDNGATWENVSATLQSSISSNSGIVKLGDRVYASFIGNGNYFTYHTTDQGQSWVLDTAGWVGSIVGNVRPAAVQLHVHGDYVLARLESNFILYRSNTDTAWKSLSLPNSHRTPGFMYSVGDTLVLGGGYIAMTTDMGANWSFRSVSTPANFSTEGFVSNIAVNKVNPAVVMASYQILRNSKQRYVISRNNQQTWDSIVLPGITSPADHSIRAFYLNGNTMLVALTGSFQANDTTHKFFQSTDGGITWTNITNNLYSFTPFKFHSISAITVVNGEIWAGGFGNKGYVKLGGLPTSFGEVTAAKMMLHLYPNPSQDFIHWAIPAQEVRVTDVSGKTVMLQSGYELQSLAVASLPAGMYFLHVETSGGTLRASFVKE